MCPFFCLFYLFSLTKEYPRVESKEPWLGHDDGECKFSFLMIKSEGELSDLTKFYQTSYIFEKYVEWYIKT